MDVSKKFSKYNDKKFGRPWIGKVTSWPTGGRAEIEFGTWNGDAEAGGCCDIEAEAGDLLRWGQKALKETDKFNSFWGVVKDDGTIKEIPWQDAKDVWSKKAPSKKAINWSTISNEELVEEALKRKFVIYPEDEEAASLDDVPEEN